MSVPQVTINKRMYVHVRLCCQGWKGYGKFASRAATKQLISILVTRVDYPAFDASNVPYTVHDLELTCQYDISGDFGWN